MKAQPKEIVGTGYWNPERINSRIDAYVLGVGARIDKTTLGANPFQLELSPEQWTEWRKGWLDGREYQTGQTKAYFFIDRD